MHSPILVCDHCQQPRTTKGHDACIADLPDVYFACCGHGDTLGYDDEARHLAYLVEKDKPTIYGAAAVERMRELGGSPPNHVPLESVPDWAVEELNAKKHEEWEQWASYQR